MGMVRVGTRRIFSPYLSPSYDWWDHVNPAPKDPTLGIHEAFLIDAHPEKINLGVGAYRDEQGKPVVLQCVKEAARKIAGSEFMEYLPIGGSTELIDKSIALAYGENSMIVKKRMYAGVQALSGTGACRLFAEFQNRFFPDSLIYLPNPTWSNHYNIWTDTQVPCRTFRYYDQNTKKLSFTKMIEDVQRAPDRSFFLFHACARNPTGVDPSVGQWQEISFELKRKRHFPFFDMAYQGFVSDDFNLDARAIRLFMEDGHLVGCGQSFAKNMGLYGQRVGCLSILCKDEEQGNIVKSQLQHIARPIYSNPPVYGALLVSTVLNDPCLMLLWEKELKVMINRIVNIRKCLRQKLEQLGSPINWEHITNQIGMFCYSGLTTHQVLRLRNEFHIYMTNDGRISMAGITNTNLDYLVDAIHIVTKAPDNFQVYANMEV